MYHPHLKTEQAQTIVTALAQMATKLPETADLCRDALSEFRSETLAKSFNAQVALFGALANANKITWTCEVCGEERPDANISVLVRDISHEAGLEAGTIRENVRYCNDSDACFQKAQTYRHIARKR